MSAGKRRSKVRLIGLLIIIAGALGVVAAGVTLGMVSAELKAEHLTVTAMTREGPGRAPLVDPFKAYAPAGMDRGASKDVIGDLGWKPCPSGQGGNPCGRSRNSPGLA
jgi:hypothetical protein